MDSNKMTLHCPENCATLDRDSYSYYNSKRDPHPPSQEIEIVKTIFLREYGKKDPPSGRIRSGTFDDFMSSLASLKAKHVDTIILLPLHPLGKALWGAVASPYEPMDYFSIEPSLVKHNWGAGTARLKSEYKRFKKNHLPGEMEEFRLFKKNVRVLEYAKYNAAKLISREKNRALNDFTDYKDEPHYKLLMEETLFEQFVARKKFLGFIEHAHWLGLKIIMDIPGYFGTDSIADLFYENYIRKNKDGTYYQPGFDQWGHGWYTLRQMEVNNSKALHYLCSIYRYWVDEFKVDGFRIDAILTQPDLYVKAIRQAVPHTFLLGETIGTFKGDIERKYIDELKLDSIYNPEWIWTGDIKKYLVKAHKRPSGRRLFHMRDTHDEGRLKKGDPFSIPRKKYLSLLAMALLGLPGKDIIGFLDGNFDLLEGTPELHELYLKEFYVADQSSICFSDGTELGSSEYIKRLIYLRKKLDPLRKSGNIVFLEQWSKQISSYVREGEKLDVIVISNVGDVNFSGSVKIPVRAGFFIDENRDICKDLISGKRIGIPCSTGKGIILTLDIGQSVAFSLKKGDCSLLRKQI
ncbi:MAG: alpha-amylase family glycosyl hydrolase [Deltaproteobacteria bacterium]|nr:alpha-amylase family glycosyl hydrolase [Deltaproteobacteria bacterium]